MGTGKYGLGQPKGRRKNFPAHKNEDSSKSATYIPVQLGHIFAYKSVKAIPGGEYGN